jgi:DNA-binding IscR family transcriptional regulator
VGNEEAGFCVHRGGCTLRALWGALEHWLRAALDRITLADLLQDEGRIPELLRSHLAEVGAELPPLLQLNARRTAEV